METARKTYRAVIHFRPAGDLKDGHTAVCAPTYRYDAHVILEHTVNCGAATGGHIEEWVDGVGWVVDNEPCAFGLPKSKNPPEPILPYQAAPPEADTEEDDRFELTRQ